jgi:hypothetical protein
MPLGIKVASALYQLEFSSLLRSQLNPDLLETWEQHKELIEQIFQRYNFANIRVNEKKTQLCAKQVIYLGYRFDETGVRISDTSAQIIKDWPVPKNIKQVRSFLGSINYLRRTVLRYADLTHALRELLRPNAEFKWGPEQQKLFELIKQTLASDIVLAYPRFDNLKDCHS